MNTNIGVAVDGDGGRREAVAARRRHRSEVSGVYIVDDEAGQCAMSLYALLVIAAKGVE
jgi:hypothetical protein